MKQRIDTPETGKREMKRASTVINGSNLNVQVRVRVKCCLFKLQINLFNNKYEMDASCFVIVWLLFGSYYHELQIKHNVKI